eukprot:6078976-Pyramimonas_sp.AAC.1
MLPHQSALVQQEGRQDGGGRVRASVHDEPLLPESGCDGGFSTPDGGSCGAAGVHSLGERQVESRCGSQGGLGERCRALAPEVRDGTGRDSETLGGVDLEREAPAIGVQCFH